MSDLSVPQMLEQVPLGRIHVFEATPGYQPAEQRFLIVSRSEKWDATAKATGVRWLNRPEVGAIPMSGSVDRPRRALSTAQTIQVELTGPAEFALDYYQYTSDICFMSKKMKQLIESKDPSALEFVKVDVKVEDGTIGEYYAAMPIALKFAVDTGATNVTVENKEFLPGKFIKTIYYEGDIYIDGAIPRHVHLFKDYGDIRWFWSNELVELVASNGIRGLYAKSPISGPGTKIVEL